MDEDRLKRHDLTDEEWARLEPLLPGHPRRGHRWNDHRMVINGVFCRTRTGARGGICRSGTGTGRRSTTGIAAGQPTGPGRGSWTGCAGCDQAKRARAWTVAIDATWCGRTSMRPGRGAPPGDVDPERLASAQRASRPARGAPSNDKNREALGRSRGGLTSKIHLLADSGCRPLARVTSAGQRHDSLAFVPLMDRLRIARPGPGGRGPGPGRCWATRPTPAGRSAPTCADAGSRRPSPNPPTRSNRLQRGSRGGRPPAFDAAAYKQRNVVERAFNQLRQHRAVATRYDKRDFVFRGTIDVASIRIWLRQPVP